MNFELENNITKNRFIKSNAKVALNEYKLEIANELNNFSSDEFSTHYLGDITSKKLVEIGEKELLKRYNIKI